MPHGAGVARTPLIGVGSLQNCTFSPLAVAIAANCVCSASEKITTWPGAERTPRFTIDKFRRAGRVATSAPKMAIAKKITVRRMLRCCTNAGHSMPWTTLTKSASES